MTDRTTELKKDYSDMSHEVESRQMTMIENMMVTTPRLLQYDKWISKTRSIFIQRNSVYKDTFVFLGLLGTVITLVGDMYRLRNMVVHTPDHGRQYKEQIEDKLIDVVNQAVISLMMLEENNFEGK